MKRILYFLLAGAASSLVSACDEVDIAKNTPTCIRTQTEEFARSAACTTDNRTIGASVKEYRFQGQTVYVLDQGSCISDGSAQVISENCQRLGFLGGFAGNTIINGESFDKAEYQRTIWQK
ncbi:DUF6970 domain-containing protein [Hymenobacter rigui]|uniref:DUF6970 domain-containing protein n=1 Tax=Hymenobacter rigui TaxID=334424 RepID=A0A3R9MIZ0_9BACT|nr:hypothetical protein [Hymenobacter rigui]RSK46965.1 hypothetical protein EI291_16715 [Hymenobacter rigui]